MFIQAELDSLNGVSHDSAKLLTEKLALSRELALLKPEIEHLRSQLTHQKDVLAEKLALERQLNTLEVELANEKRATQRALQKQDHQDTEVEDDLRRQLREAEKKLVAVKRTNGRVTRSRDSIAPGAEEELQELRERLAHAEKKLLASEKRAKSRAAGDKVQKDADGAAELEKLRTKLAEVENQLAAEKKDRQRIQEESEGAKAQAEERKETAEAAEEKFAKLKAKLREVQQELKQCRAELQQARDQQPEPTLSMDVTTTRMIPIKAPASQRKRRANEMSNDEMVVYSPDHIDSRPKRPLKKRVLEAAVGEKSTFSITPFLNRTINLAEALSPKSVTKTLNFPVFQFHGDDAPTTQITQSLQAVTPTVPASIRQARKDSTAAKVPKPRGRPRKALTDASPVTKNLQAPSLGKELPVEPTLDRVMEDADEASAEQENRTIETSTSKTTLDVSGARPATAVSEAEPKKKRRKLLGGGSKKTIFDNDEDDGESETAKRPVKVQLGAAAAAAAAVRPLSKLSKAKVAMGVARSAFGGGTFSPLKRHKRGVNASFLA